MKKNVCDTLNLLCVVPSDEQRRSLADLRNSVFIQTKENLSVSVKAISALYLSKVAPQKTATTPTKQVKGCHRLRPADFVQACLINKDIILIIV